MAWNRITELALFSRNTANTECPAVRRPEARWIIDRSLQRPVLRLAWTTDDEFQAQSA